MKVVRQSSSEPNLFVICRLLWWNWHREPFSESKLPRTSRVLNYKYHRPKLQAFDSEGTTAMPLSALQSNDPLCPRVGRPELRR